MPLFERGSAASHSCSSSTTPQLSSFSLPSLADSSQEAANLPQARGLPVVRTSDDPYFSLAALDFFCVSTELGIVFATGPTWK